MGKIATAFFWSLFLAILAGLVFSPVMVWFDLPWWVSPAMASGLTIIQAWVQSRELLARALGHREKPGVVVQNRAIPISAGGLAMAFESIMPGARREAIEVDDSLSVVTATGLVVSPERVEDFIRRAVTRQYRGKPGLSRSYWLNEYRPPWDRSEYDAMVYVLSQNGFIDGRKPGRAGKVNSDYRTIITTLRRVG